MGLHLIPSKSNSTSKSTYVPIFGSVHIVKPHIVNDLTVPIPRPLQEIYAYCVTFVVNGVILSVQKSSHEMHSQLD